MHLQNTPFRHDTHPITIVLPPMQKLRKRPEVGKVRWTRTNRNYRIVGIELRFKPGQIGDFEKLEYNSHTDIVLVYFRKPFTAGLLMERDTGLDRFRLYRRMAMSRGPVTFRKVWRRMHPRYSPEP